MRGQERVAPVNDPARDPLPERVVVRDRPERPAHERGERDLKADLGRHARAERLEAHVPGHAQLPDVVRRRHPHLDHNLPVFRRPLAVRSLRRL